jgi:hypothetical protein
LIAGFLFWSFFHESAVALLASLGRTSRAVGFERRRRALHVPAIVLPTCLVRKSGMIASSAAGAFPSP